MSTTMSLDEISSIYYEKGVAIRIIGGSYPKRGITTGWINKARGNQGWTKHKVHIIYKDDKGEMIASKGPISKNNIQIINKQSEEKRSKSFLLSALDQHVEIQMAVKKLSNQLAGLQLLGACQPIRESDVNEFCIEFKKMVVADLANRMTSTKWKGQLYSVHYEHNLEGFGVVWWQRNI